MTMGRFDTCVAFVLEREGGYVDDPDDHGGATNYGITQATYDQYRARSGLTPQSVRDMPQSEAKGVYLTDYWLAVSADKFPEPLDCVMFDTAVQHGVGTAIRMLQRVVGVPIDGICGPVTRQAAQTYLARALLRNRREYYADIIRHDPTQKKFEKGWGNRLFALTRACGLA